MSCEREMKKLVIIIFVITIIVSSHHIQISWLGTYIFDISQGFSKCIPNLIASSFYSLYIDYLIQCTFESVKISIRLRDYGPLLTNHQNKSTLYLYLYACHYKSKPCVA